MSGPAACCSPPASEIVSSPGAGPESEGAVSVVSEGGPPVSSVGDQSSNNSDSPNSSSDSFVCGGGALLVGLDGAGALSETLLEKPVSALPGSASPSPEGTVGPLTLLSIGSISALPPRLPPSLSARLT